MVEIAAANVLANHEILMASPSAARLNSFFPSPPESISTIVVQPEKEESKRGKRRRRGWRKFLGRGR